MTTVVGFTAATADLAGEEPDVQNYWRANTGHLAIVIIDFYDDNNEVTHSIQQALRFVFDTESEALEAANDRADELLQSAVRRGFASPIPNFTDINNN